MSSFSKQGMTLLEVVKAYPEAVAKAIEELHTRYAGLNVHIITGPYGRCECGKDGKTCAQILTDL